MSNFINENARELSYGGAERNTTDLIIGPIKTVTDPEQFVPLFTCKPRRAPGRGAGVRSNTFGTVFWEHTSKFLDSVSNPVANSLSSVLVTAGREHSTLFQVSRQSQGLGRLTLKEWTVLRNAIEKGLITVDHTTWVNSIVETFDGALPPTIASSPGWRYGLKETGEIVAVNTMNFLLDATSDSFNKGLCIAIALGGVDHYVYSDWFYLASVQKRDADRVPTIPGFTPDPCVYSSIAASLFNGVSSMFCVMIKEKHRLDVMLNLWTTGTLGELPKGSIELWESKDLRSYLGTDYKHYQRTIQSIVRNGHKSPVRVFDDLDAQLFDIKKVEFNSPAEIEVEANAVLKRARAIAAMATDSIYRPNLQLDIRTTHVNL